MKYFIIIFIIILFLIFLNYFYYSYRHRFWRKQPISNMFYFNYKDTVISYKIPKSIKISEKYSIKDIQNLEGLELVYNFLNKNYQNSKNDEYISFKYFLWSLKAPFTYDSLILCIFNNSNIIGSISGKGINIKLNNYQLTTTYVDYLCIDKLYRSQNLSPLLISHLAEKGFKNSKIYIFKKEDNPLPFRPIITYHNYCLKYEILKKKIEIKKNYDFIKRLEPKNIFKCFEYYSNFCKKNYDFYRIYSIFEFKYYFTKNNYNKHGETFFFETNNIIRGIISFYPLILKNNSNKLYYQIKFILADNEEIINNLFSFFIIYISNNTDLVIISDLGHHNIIIERYNFVKDMITNIHMYNYHVNKNLSVKRSCIHFI